MKSVKAFAPATVANVGSAFDVLGFSLSSPGDFVEVSFQDSPGVSLSSIEGDDGRLPTAPEKNCACAPIAAMLKDLGEEKGIAVSLKKELPLGSGLGSSAASSAAAVVAANELLGKPFNREQLVSFAMLGEEIACGTPHADNVAPAVLGGFVLVRSYSPLDLVQLPTPENLFCSVVHPHIELNTADARKVLRKTISLEKAIAQWGNIAGLVAGLYRSDLELIGRSLEDLIIEPERGSIIPGFEKAKVAAMEAGALGCGISGSGPSLFAFSNSMNIAQAVSSSMQNAFSNLDLECDTYSGEISTKGAHVIE